MTLNLIFSLLKIKFICFLIVVIVVFIINDIDDTFFNY